MQPPVRDRAGNCRVDPGGKQPDDNQVAKAYRGKKTLADNWLHLRATAHWPLLRNGERRTFREASCTSPERRNSFLTATRHGLKLAKADQAGQVPRVRLTVVSTSYPLSPGQAAGHFVQSEVEQKCRQGAQVTVIAPGPRTERGGVNPVVVRVGAGNLFGPPGVLTRIHHRPSRLVHLPGFLREARRVVLGLKDQQRVIAHWLLPCAWPICRSLPTPLEVVVHGSDVGLAERLPRPLLRPLVKSLLQGGAEFRFVATSLRRRLGKAAGIDLGPFSRVQPCEAQVSLAPSRVDSRRMLHLEVERRLIVVVSRLISSKRVAVALQSLERLPRSRIVVIGDGPLRPPLSQRFPSIEFMGALSHQQTLSWTAAADVLVSASLQEGAPLAIREARALGVPVVASPAGDLPELAALDPGLWLLPGTAR